MTSENFLTETYLSRQPILDVHEDLIGYELSLYPSGGGASISRNGEASAAALLVCAAYAELGIRSALGRHRAFLSVDQEFLHDDAVEALPPESVVLQLEVDGIPDERTLERCRILRERRYALALANYTGLDERSSPLLGLLDYVKIDIGGKDDQRLMELAGPLANLPLKLLAEGVRTRNDFSLCQSHGFQLFQGHYFSSPEIVSGRHLSASQATIIQLINLAARDADTAKLEDGLKHDPALAVNLLSIVNSVAYGFSQRISSLRQAIMVLGRRQLQRWLHLLLMTPYGKVPDASRVPLLQVAALRGRMLELMVSMVHPNNPALAEQAFITGIMSMMPAALGMPMNEIFEQISLESGIVSALQSYEGVLGKMLALIECYDAEESEGCDEILSGFEGTPLDRQALNSCLLDALRWINDAEDGK